MKILIVCSGNTCRSPMAGALLRMIANSRGLIVNVRTAGLKTHHDGGRVAEKAVMVMKELEIDISGERPKPVTKAELDWADLIVTVQDGLAPSFETTS